MNITPFLNKEGFSLFSVSASVFIHFLVLVSAWFFTDLFGRHSSEGHSYIELETGEFESAEHPLQKHEDIVPPVKEIKKEKETDINAGLNIPGIINSSADTSVLMQVYTESSLNVRIKYPSGWTYIDQNRRNKLDGVTFWFSADAYNPPPYVHLEVKEKYLFNPERYKYKFKLNDAYAYFNDPEELAGQFSQTIYLRTETDEDFSIKLIMKGKESFYSFQPLFFAMVKTFKFGRNFF